MARNVRSPVRYTVFIYRFRLCTFGWEAKKALQNNRAQGTGDFALTKTVVANPAD